MMTTTTVHLSLVDRLRQLCLLAQQSAAPELWIQETADAIVDALLSLETFERDSVDPRRRRSTAQARQMANAVTAMRQAGFTHGAAVGALRERTGLSRSRVYALLKMSCNNAGQSPG
jgi:hypothetical protein